jgi:hypothetical protein
VEQEIEEHERHVSVRATEWALDQVSGSRLENPEVTVRANSSSVGLNGFTVLVSGTMRNTMRFSATLHEEPLDVFRITRSTGLFTSTADCAREIEASCQDICSQGRYDSNGGKVVVLWYSPPPGNKRRDRCRLEAPVHAYSKRGRQGLCRAYQLNATNCSAPATSVQHPIPGCDYFQAVMQTRWSYQLNCAPHGGAWACSGPEKSYQQCELAHLQTGAPQPPDFCAGITSQLFGVEIDASRASTFQRLLDDSFEP